MFLEFGLREREAECFRCHRRSPVLREGEDAALETLRDLGWVSERGGAWRCPVCRDRLSGQFRITGR